ncbi:MAG: glucose-6-phosphate isomerase family protein [Bacillota bacterium]
MYSKRLPFDGSHPRLGGGVQADLAVRTMGELRPYLQDSDCPGPDEVYFMYRELTHADDAAVWSHHRIKHDITVVPPGRLGREYIRTAGHYHPEAERGLTYPELYQVVQGEAVFILQHLAGDGLVSEVVMVAAAPGDEVIIPPGWGHVTVNQGQSDLVIADIVAADFLSIYRPYQEQAGPAYYLLSSPAGKAEPNPNYPERPLVTMLQARQWQERSGWSNGGGWLYDQFMAAPGRWEFLLRPTHRWAGC